MNELVMFGDIQLIRFWESCLIQNSRYSKYRSDDDPAKVITVSVPALVDSEIWQRAQAQKKQNAFEVTRNVKHDYLVRRRVACGECGSAMTVCFVTSKGKDFFYYKCDTPYDKGTCGVRTCTQNKHFRADHIDALAWEWVKSYLADPAKLAEGLAAYQTERERETAPLRDRLTMLDKLIADNRGQLDRLLDLYLAGDFPKDSLLERKARLANTIAALEREREGLAAQMTMQSLTEDDMQSMIEFAAEVAQGLEKAGHDFETRRRIIEILDLQVTLAIEGGEKVIYPRCRFWNGERLSVATTNINTCAHIIVLHKAHRPRRLAE